MKKFIIPVLHASTKDGTYPTNRFNNGFAPIIGPIDDNKIEETISSLKKESGTSSELKYIVFSGELY